LKNAVKRAFIAAGILGFIALCLWLIYRPAAVECVVAESGLLRNTFTEIGEITPIYETDLYAKTGGKLLETYAVEGAVTAKGDLLFVFDGLDFKLEEDGVLAEIAVLDSQINSLITSLETQKKATLAEAESLKIQIRQAQAEEEKRSADLESMTRLHEHGALSAQDLADSRTAYEQSKVSRELLANQSRLAAIRLSETEAELALLDDRQPAPDAGATAPRQQLLARKDACLTRLSSLRERLGDIEVVAPGAGILRDSPLKAGQIVPPGTKLCSIYQADAYRVDCYILVENTLGVNEGDPVEITLRMRGGDATYRGTISRKSPDAVSKVSRIGVSEKRVKVEVAISIADWVAIGPYWPVEVCFETARAENCLLAPKTALFEDGGDIWKVWVIRDGKARALTVERGIQSPSMVEIKSGLLPGDTIVKNVRASDLSEGKSCRAVI